MANLLSQQGISAAVGPDGYTISILATSPPTYMELNSRTMTMNGTAVKGFIPDLLGFCMDVVPTTPPTPVVCGGSFENGNSFSSLCWQLGLEASSSKSITNLCKHKVDARSLPTAPSLQFGRVSFPTLLQVQSPLPLILTWSVLI